MIDDWSRTNIDTEGPGAVCTRVVIHPPVKCRPTSWDTKALAIDGRCFCSNDVTSGELFLVQVRKKSTKSCTCSLAWLADHSVEQMRPFPLELVNSLFEAMHLSCKCANALRQHQVNMMCNSMYS